MKWDELRSHFDRLYRTEAPDAGLARQSIDAYQVELLKLYDRWAGVNTEGKRLTRRCIPKQSSF